MSPVGWYEVDPTPAPVDRCLLCGEPRENHDYLACDRARFTDPADLCEACMGTGVLGDVRRSDYDGRRCQACAGQGFVESSSQAGEQA